MDSLLRYSVGDTIVHPSHGAGVIVDVERKQIGERKNRYYVIEMHDMRVMVPVKRAQTIGLRPVMRESRLRQALADCRKHLPDDKVIRDYRKRKAALEGALSSGEYRQWISAVRVLHRISNRRPLGIGDLEMYKRGKSILASELALSSGESFDDAHREIEEMLACATMH